jgi:putative membrane protein
MKQSITCAIAMAATLSLGGVALAQQPSPNSTAGKSSADTGFVKEAAMGGMAEVELGRLALQKASSNDVKQFAQRMVDDHSKANDQLKPIAQQKNITVPTQLTGKHKAEYDRLSKLSGAEFDRAYMQLMLQDHRKDVSDFRKESTGGKDQDVKQFATQTLPTLEDHLKMAQSTAGATATSGGANGRTKGTTGTTDTDHGAHTTAPGAGTTGTQQGTTTPGR